MSNKDSRQGGKYTGNHTTLTPVAALLCDIAHNSPHVTRISPGFLKVGLKPANGGRRVKIIDKDGGILLSVRGGTSHQEVHVYVNNLHEARLAIARGARDNNIAISFGRGES